MNTLIRARSHALKFFMLRRSPHSSAPTLPTLLAFLTLSTINTQISTATAQGTAFTYQGRLTDNGSLATGYYDMLFSLYDAPTAGSQVDGTLMQTAVPVTNGLFTISLDFGPGLFTGAGRWLKIDVRTNNGAAYIPLGPRQALTATPYAITASNLTGNLPASQVSGTLALTQLPGAVVTNNQGGVSLSGTFAGNGAGVSNVNALTLGGLGTANFWKTAGNAGTSGGANFFGTTDGQPLELKVNNGRALRIEPTTNSPNLIGGSPRNFVGAGVVGATIAGGGATNYTGIGYTNSVLGDYGFIGGGVGNSLGIFSRASAIAGGGGNTISSSEAGAIAGGENNSISNCLFATIAGGYENLIGSIGGIEGPTIGGGEENSVDGNLATVAGGGNNHIGVLADYSAISGGAVNNIAGGNSYATIAGGGFNFIDMNSGGSFIGGGGAHTISSNSPSVTIAGGASHKVGTNAASSTISGGSDNGIDANSAYSTIGGGQDNFIFSNSGYSTIGGGQDNVVDSGWGTIAGGTGNNARGGNATISGGFQNIADENGTIGGGDHNTASNYNATVGGGRFNTASANATVGGGELNLASGIDATIGGGDGNIASGFMAAVAGGLHNIASGGGAFIGGGGTYGGPSPVYGSNLASGASSVIGGGIFNFATNLFAVVPGGSNNVAGGALSFAAGRAAKAIHTGSFVWGDSTPADIASTNADSVTFRAAGGVRFFSDTNASAGVFLAPGGTSWAVISDRNVKKDFEPVNSEALLEKLAALPITQWHYKWEEQNVTPHIGPMAQDFKAAFYPGSDDKSITTQEADGVELAAIQALNQKIEQKETEITELRKSVDELKTLISKLAGERK